LGNQYDLIAIVIASRFEGMTFRMTVRDVFILIQKKKNMLGMK